MSKQIIFPSIPIFLMKLFKMYFSNCEHTYNAAIRTIWGYKFARINFVGTTALFKKVDRQVNILCVPLILQQLAAGPA
jgi:hypothetical protein